MQTQINGHSDSHAGGHPLFRFRVCIISTSSLAGAGSVGKGRTYSVTDTSQKSQSNDGISTGDCQHVAQHVLCSLEKYETVRMGLEIRQSNLRMIGESVGVVSGLAHGKLMGAVTYRLAVLAMQLNSNVDPDL
jgi:hypothetical protein